MFYGYCIPPLPAQSADWGARRNGRSLRRCVERHAVELDTALAAGADPAGSDDLRLRAEQLMLPEGPERLARSIDRLVKLVDDGSRTKHRVGDGKRPRRVSVSEKKVWASRPLLVELAERLRGGSRLSLRAVAMASLLLTDRGGPLYDGDLDRRLQRAAQTTLSLFERERAYVRR